jgi:hypothetical protein
MRYTLKRPQLQGIDGDPWQLLRNWGYGIRHAEELHPANKNVSTLGSGFFHRDALRLKSYDDLEPKDSIMLHSSF